LGGGAEHSRAALPGGVRRGEWNRCGAAAGDLDGWRILQAAGKLGEREVVFGYKGAPRGLEMRASRSIDGARAIEGATVTVMVTATAPWLETINSGETAVLGRGGGAAKTQESKSTGERRLWGSTNCSCALVFVKGRCLAQAKCYLQHQRQISSQVHVCACPPALTPKLDVAIRNADSLADGNFQSLSSPTLKVSFFVPIRRWVILKKKRVKTYRITPCWIGTRRLGRWRKEWRKE